jgi:hypothetical protein
LFVDRFWIQEAFPDEGVESASSYGWYVTADGRLEEIRVAHGELRTVRENIHLLLLGAGAMTPLHAWKLGRVADRVTVLLRRYY